MSSIFIARAECRLGRIEEARRLIGAARARGLSWRLPADLEMLLARAESEIEAHRSEIPASGDP
jgi:hypothetical protein